MLRITSDKSLTNIKAIPPHTPNTMLGKVNDIISTMIEKFFCQFLKPITLNNENSLVRNIMFESKILKIDKNTTKPKATKIA